jgi:putative transposase
MKYRRFQTPGGTYFFTVVTYGRQKVFSDPLNISLLRSSFRYVIRAHPFKINACVVLPDHLHTIWTLPEGDADFPTR